MKKVFALLLALTMVFGLAATASAYTIKVENSADGATVAGHTYNVYQIFTGDLATDDNDTPENPDDDKQILSNIVYGQNYGTEGKAVPQTELDALAKMSGAAAAAELKKGIINDPIAVLDDDNGHTVTGLAAGYYLIIDVTEKLPENETSSAFILQIVEDVTVQSKHTAGPKVEKKVDDKNDSNTSEDAIIWNDSADHDIGDLIDFQLTATIPSAFTLFKDNNKAYPFTFHDTEEQGLTFNSITGVYVVNGETKTAIDASQYTVKTSGTCGCTFEVAFTDLTAIDGVVAGSEIVVEYKSMLNESAIIGNKGNVNEVYGEYRNYYDTEKPNFTPKDTVIVFTYKVVVDKTDENEQPLAGATFTLEKFVASAEGTETYKDVTGTWVAQDVVTTEPGTTFSFTGLDDGEYRLTETKTPAGYNTIDPIYFTVTAAHTIEWTNQARTDVLTGLSGKVATGEIKFTESADHGTLDTDVVNKSGTVLPETGGMGTTVFYVLGGFLAVGAAVLLVTKKRMNAM